MITLSLFEVSNSSSILDLLLTPEDLFLCDCFQFLYNLSLELNERWLKNPNINNKQIILDHPLAFNDQNSSFDFYI